MTEIEDRRVQSQAEGLRVLKEIEGAVRGTHSLSDTHWLTEELLKLSQKVAELLVEEAHNGGAPMHANLLGVLTAKIGRLEVEQKIRKREGAIAVRVLAELLTEEHASETVAEIENALMADKLDADN